jgi:Flp pilus assembly protein TadG
MSSHSQSFVVDERGGSGRNGRQSRVLRNGLTCLLQRFRRDERGNVMIMGAIFIPVAIAAVGAAVSYSSGNAARTNMQAALDSAVLAGAIAMDSGTDPIATAQNAFQSNVASFTKSTASNIAASFTLSGITISGQASADATNPFGGIIGTRTYALGVTAAATKQSMPVCVLGLNGLDNGSFDVNGNPQVDIGCAVQANTTSRTGMTQEGNAPVTAKKFGVTGGHKTNNYSPPPTDGSAKINDPYASLRFPYYDDCSKGGGNKNVDIKDSTTLSPGTYCGGLHIFGNGTVVTLQPGIYVMVDGPLWIDGNATLTGDRVMIAFTGKGSTLQVWGNSVVNLTSPTSGTYVNMQFFQNPNDDNTRGLWASIGGSSGGNQGSAKLTYDGVAYFPTQNFWVFGNAVMNANSPGVAVVADKVWVQGSATFNVTNNNPRSLPVKAPTITYGAKLLN